MRRHRIAVLVGLLALATSSQAAPPEITHFSPAGVLAWTNAYPGTTCHVEMAESLPASNWVRVASVTATNEFMMATVPLTNQTGFYRVADTYTLRDGLMVYFPFNGDAVDASGKYTGQVYGATLTMDRHGTTNSAYHFDGVDDIVKVPVGNDLEPDTEITLACWIKPDHSITVAQRCSRILRKAGAFADGYLLSWSNSDGSNTDNLLSLRMAYPLVVVGVPNAPYVGAWHHVAATFSERTREARLYADGV